MATFNARPKVLIEIDDLDDDILDDFADEIEKYGGRWIRRGCQSGHVLLDFDIAEKAIAWLKSNGVRRSNGR